MRRLGVLLGTVVVAGLLAGCGGGGSTEDATQLDGQEVVDELSVVAKACDAASYFAAREALDRLDRIAERNPNATVHASRGIQGELGRLERGLRPPLTARPIGRTIEDGPTDAGTISDVLHAVERTYGVCLEGNALRDLQATLQKISGQQDR